MRVFGVRLPTPLSHRKFEETVLPIIEADDQIAYALMPMIAAWRSLYAAFLELDRRVKSTARKDPVCLLLMTAPGVGPMAAKRSVTQARRTKPPKNQIQELD
jgi:transposase